MSRVARTFALDLRSLAAFRVGLALCVLLDAVTRAVDARVLLTDAAVTSRVAWFARAGPDLWSLHAATGTLAGQLLLLGAGALVAVALGAGWRTRAMCVVALVLTVSLQNRAPPVFYGFDLLLRVLLLWACFLPLGARWSLDARAVSRGTRAPASPDAHASPATAALTLQVLAVYVTSGLQKLQHESWRDLDSVWLALTTDHHATALARLLASHVDAARALSVVVLALELLLPFALLAPLVLPLGARARDATRGALVVAFALFHVGTGLLFALGLFPLVGVVAWLPFVPAAAWARLAPRATHGALDVDTSRARALAVGALAVIVACVNVESVAGRDVLPPSLARLVRVARLDQTWNMFERPATDGWFVARLTRADGRVVDVLAHGPGMFDAPLADRRAKPADLSSTFASMRWRKLLTNMPRAHMATWRAPFLRAVCVAANARVNDSDDAARVRRAELVMVVEAEAPGAAPVISERALAAAPCPSQR